MPNFLESPALKELHWTITKSNLRMSEAKAKRDNGEDSAESEEGERHALDDRKWNKAFRGDRLKIWLENRLA